MSEREHRAPARGHALVSAPAHDRTGPPWIVASILRFQRLAGNGAVASALAGRERATASVNALGAIQRANPTRAENIAALRSELAGAETDPAKWKDVALRLNGFDKGDLPAICAEIPATQLQAARSAVERYLPGWPTQTAILAALDARARKKKVSLRPLGSSIWAAYSQVGYNVWSGPGLKNKVWEHIGGSVGKRYAGGDTCAARVSWSFNYGGFPITGRGETNDSKKTYKGKKGDGKNYIVWVPSLQSYLTSQWGKPDAMLRSNAEAIAFEAILRPGEVAVFAGPHHAGLFMQGYDDAYVKSDPGVMPVAVWKLPM
ncbi:MAG: T6SS effector amidase Tae4 family protein [Pseudonocardiaceae bacterium]